LIGKKGGGSVSAAPRQGVLDGANVIDCVTLTQVPVSQSPVIANLMQLYKYDFSEFAQIGSPYG
jgi:hypothetical protein